MPIRFARCSALTVSSLLCAATGLAGPCATTPTTFCVTVGPKTPAHPNQGGWLEAYYINGVEGAVVTLERGTAYTFQMVDVPFHHPFYISTSSTGAGAGVYSNGVIGNFAAGNATLTFTPDAGAPDLLFYECSNHLRMGWQIRIVNPCPGDANGDRIVNFADLNIVLGEFGLTGAGLAGDVNGDGVVNFADLNLVLSNFGTAC